MKEKKIPMRKCVGCTQSKPKKELIRIAGYEGEVTVDLTGKAKGRGIYICKDKACLEKAIKRKAIKRGLSIELDENQEELLRENLLEVLSEQA